jgi:hypothetical protein
LGSSLSTIKAKNTVVGRQGIPAVDRNLPSNVHQEPPTAVEGWGNRECAVGDPLEHEVMKHLVPPLLSSFRNASQSKMIAVISDLHFEEEASDVIPGQGGRPGLIFRRNLDPRAYCNFIAQMAEQMKRRRLRTFDLVIAGDLFDFNRTVLWFRDDLRPYVPLSKVTLPLEAKLLNILEGIAAEPPVKQSLEALRLLAKGRYRLD